MPQNHPATVFAFEEISVIKDLLQSITSAPNHIHFLSCYTSAGLIRLSSLCALSKFQVGLCKSRLPVWLLILYLQGILLIFVNFSLCLSLFPPSKHLALHISIWIKMHIVLILCQCSNTGTCLSLCLSFINSMHDASSRSNETYNASSTVLLRPKCARSNVRNANPRNEQDK